MVELIRGIKAGVVAGLIWGVVHALLGSVFFVFIASLLGIPTTPPPFGGRYVALRVNPFMGLIIGPIFGVILGIIFAFTYNRLPGKQLSSMAKGMVLALTVWVILFLMTVPTGVSTGLFFSELEEYRTLQIIMTAFALWFFVIFLGQQLGRFWDRFKPK